MGVKLDTNATKAPLLYWIPADTQPPAYLGAGLACKKPAFGPVKGAAGSLISPLAGSLEYEPEEQSWFPLPGGAWLGITKGARFSPQMFARAEQRVGHPVRMGGHDWQIPVARLATGGIGLPKRRTLRADGSLDWTVEEAYRSLSDMAEQVWNAFVAGDGNLLVGDLDALCGEALAVNYRLGVREAAVIGLLTDAAMQQIARALIDWPTIEDLLKKKAPTTPDGSATASGVSASSNTPPPMQTSG